MNAHKELFSFSVRSENQIKIPSEISDEEADRSSVTGILAKTIYRKNNWLFYLLNHTASSLLFS